MKPCPNCLGLATQIVGRQIITANKSPSSNSFTNQKPSHQFSQIKIPFHTVNQFPQMTLSLSALRGCPPYCFKNSTFSTVQNKSKLFKTGLSAWFMWEYSSHFQQDLPLAVYFACTNTNTEELALLLQ